MSGLIAGLAGAPQAASNTDSYYTNAMNNEINAAGSPAATDFLRLQDASLRPQFASADQQVGSTLAAQGLAGSGAGRNIGGSVASNQAGTLAGVAAPLYQSALNSYSGINAEAPSAENQSYQNAIQSFMQSLQSGASLAGDAFGIPSGGGTSGSTTGIWDPYGGGDSSGSGSSQSGNENPYA